ncbi:hypothetical protein [Ponticaulis sp.]|uniref:hypothetical protein n=1 Tax=Ponticaulis sp. TaxID=2020902 RepID=UPI000C5CDDC7|nr:hypothetical protein [Ponticaulis sp.]MAF57285.1 hypothetical protein [Ponticaulis sp.]MBN03497.1 hypothetical protein [Ponticaulis sp.]
MAGSGAGWKTFFFEVIIVVVGVIIALLANHFVTQLNRRADMLEMMRGVELDLLTIVQVASERLATEPCRLEQERHLLALLQRDDPFWQPEVSAALNTGLDSQAVPSVLRMPIRNWPETAWRAAASSDSVFALDRVQVTGLNDVFEIAADVNFTMDELREKKAQLSHLAIEGEISAAQRRDAIALLADISTLESLLVVNVTDAREAILNYHDFQTDATLTDYDYTAEDVEAALVETIGNGRSIYGECVQASEYAPFVDLTERLIDIEIDRSVLEIPNEEAAE